MIWRSAWLLFGLLLRSVAAEGTCQDAAGDSGSCSSTAASDAALDGTDSSELYLLQTDFRVGNYAPSKEKALQQRPHAAMATVKTAYNEPVSKAASMKQTTVQRTQTVKERQMQTTKPVMHAVTMATKPTEKSKAASKGTEPKVMIDTSGGAMDVDDLGSKLWQTGFQLSQTEAKASTTSSEPPLGHPAIPPRHPESPQSKAARATGVTLNAAGDLMAFVTATLVNTFGILFLVGIFMILRSRYPMTFHNNLLVNSPPLDTIPEGMFGWMRASWSVTTEQVIENAGLDQAMLLEFMHMGMRIMIMAGIPMFCVMGPINATFGGHVAGPDHLSYFSFGNVADGSNLYWIHAVIVWGVILVVQSSVYGAQKNFLKSRFEWLRNLPNPRANTVLVEGIPDAQRSDAALKTFFNQMFGGSDKVTSAYVVRTAPELEAVWKKREAMMQACAKARFKARQANAVDADKEEIVKLQDELAELEKTFSEEQQKVKSKSFIPGPDGYHACAGFVTFKEKSDALLALSMQLGEDADEWELSLPPEPNSVLYHDLQQGATSSQMSMALGYLLTAGLYVLYMPAVIGITQIAESFKNFGALQPLFDAFAPTVGLMVMVAFLPTFLINIFRLCFTLKDDAWAQQMLQNWYFLFQLVFVVLVTAISGSTLDFMKTFVQDPLGVCALLGSTMPNATHFYMNYIVLQWTSEALNLVRAAPLSKWILFRTMYDDETARQMAEPEDQDYYGIGSRSCRMTINLIIGIIYSTLCPPICILTFVQFLICRVVYGYLLPFAESRKPDLGGVFWVQQLRHVFVGNIIYCLVMTTVLFGRAASIGPGIIAGCSLAYVVWSMRRFEHAFCWQSLPFKELMEPSESTPKPRSSAGEYLQPFMK